MCHTTGGQRYSQYVLTNHFFVCPANFLKNLRKIFASKNARTCVGQIVEDLSFFNVGPTTGLFFVQVCYSLTMETLDLC